MNAYLTSLLLFAALSLSGQTLQQVTDNGASTTNHISVGATDASLIGSGVGLQALNVAGKVKFLGLIDAYTSGTNANQPTIYRSGVTTGNYPFNNYDHLILQAGIQNRDILFLTGAGPSIRMLYWGLEMWALAQLPRMKNYPLMETSGHGKSK